MRPRRSGRVSDHASHLRSRHRGAERMGGTPMMSRNLRHFRVFLAVVQDRFRKRGGPALRRVAIRRHLRRLNKLDREGGGGLFQPHAERGLSLTERGRLFDARIRRADGAVLDKALAEVSPRLTLTATSTQLRALIRGERGAEFRNWRPGALGVSFAQRSPRHHPDRAGSRPSAVRTDTPSACSPRDRGRRLTTGRSPRLCRIRPGRNGPRRVRWPGRRA